MKHEIAVISYDTNMFEGEGDDIEGVDGDKFVINEFEIGSQCVSKFLIQGFWESVDSFIDFLFT